jgi:hypothetical protein
MIKALLIATIGTSCMYMMVRYIKSIRQILVFKRVREAILLSVFYYLKQTPEHVLDLEKLHQLSLNRINDCNLKKWVKRLSITWIQYDAIQVHFELNVSDIHTKYRFVVGVKEVKKNLKDHFN